MFIPVTNPALVAHWSLAVAAVDVQCSWCLVQASDGAARAQFDDLIGHVPQLESLQQVYVGHVPVLLKQKNKSNCSDCNPCCHCIANLGCFLSYKYNLKSYKRPKFHLFLTFNKTELFFLVHWLTWVRSSISLRIRSPRTISTDTAICTSPCSA